MLPVPAVCFRRPSGRRKPCLPPCWPAGEEVTISYIDEELPLVERRAALQDYGFVCACERCERERAAAAARRRCGVKAGRRK
jgi:hypothetical protein